MDTNAIKAAYRRYAKAYDLLFGHIFKAGHDAVCGLSFEEYEKILEIGVGTGLSLPMYPRNIRIVGIDLSVEMLNVARKRVADQSLYEVESLQIMDAEQMDFPDHSFDKVIAMYVLSVTPNPARLIREMRRVCRVNGEIVIVNHFRSRYRAINAIERILQPFSDLIGFTPSLDLDQTIEENKLDVIEVRDLDCLGNWKMIRFYNTQKGNHYVF